MSAGASDVEALARREASLLAQKSADVVTLTLQLHDASDFLCSLLPRHAGGVDCEEAASCGSVDWEYCWFWESLPTLGVAYGSALSNALLDDLHNRTSAARRQSTLYAWCTLLALPPALVRSRASSDVWRAGMVPSEMSSEMEMSSDVSSEVSWARAVVDEGCAQACIAEVNTKSRTRKSLGKVSHSKKSSSPWSPLCRARLCGASLCRARLCGARLCGARLCRARLSRAPCFSMCRAPHIRDLSPLSMPNPF